MGFTISNPDTATVSILRPGKTYADVYPVDSIGFRPNADETEMELFYVSTGEMIQSIAPSEMTSPVCANMAAMETEFQSLFFLNRSTGVAIGLYDFDVLGGAIGTVNLTMLTPTIPADAFVYRAFIETVTVFTSSGAGEASAGITEDADIIKNVTDIGAFPPWNQTGMQSMLPVETTLTISAKTTVTNNLTLTFSVAPITAGKCYVIAYWVRTGS